LYLYCTTLDCTVSRSESLYHIVGDKNSHLFLHLSFHLFLHLSFHLFLFLFLHLPFHLFLHLSFHLSLCLSFHFSYHLFVHLSLNLTLPPPLLPPIHPSGKTTDGRVVIQRFKELPPGVVNPAQKAVPKIKPGDVIIGINGVRSENFAECVLAIRSCVGVVEIELERLV
jgi:PDZ domain